FAFAREDQPIRMPNPRGKLFRFSDEERQRQGCSDWILKLAPRPGIGTVIPATWALLVKGLPSCGNDSFFADGVSQISEPIHQVIDAPPSGHVTHANGI